MKTKTNRRYRTTTHVLTHVESFQESHQKHRWVIGHSASAPFSGKLGAVLASRALGMS